MLIVMKMSSCGRLRGHGVVVNIPALGAGDRGFNDSRYRVLASGDAVPIAIIPLSSDLPEFLHDAFLAHTIRTFYSCIIFLKILFYFYD